MMIHIGAHVEATDGRVGDVSSVVVEPRARKLTHLLVRGHGLRGVERLLPIEDVVDAAQERVGLKVTQAEFESLTPTTAAVSYTPHGVDGLYLDASSAVSTVRVDHGLIPEDDVTVRGGERVEATDGGIGKVDGVVIDAETHVVTHLVMREGHLWHTRTVRIPLEHIDHVERDAIYLKLRKEQVDPIAQAADA
jgi:uncharacterized protein YrrD